MNKRAIHLVSFATNPFLHRQLLLGASAKLNAVVDSVTNWRPQQLLSAGFDQIIVDISLRERGSGFWAWKPFIIQKKLAEIPDGDLVLYCDVGRVYPFKLLEHPLEPLVRWMRTVRQDVLPGVAIPWDGPMSTWTKRDAFIEVGMDRPEIHLASPIQASFSMWRAGKSSRDLVSKWMALCAQRNLVSDDPSRCQEPELSGFREHRHDQALLTLCCLRANIRPLEFEGDRPAVDLKNPSEVARLLEPSDQPLPVLGRILRKSIRPLEAVEKLLRTRQGLVR